MPAEQGGDLKSLILSFSFLFSNIPTCTSVIEHEIDAGEAAPIRQRFYRAPEVKQNILEGDVQYLLENGLAKLFNSGLTPHKFLEGKCPFYMD